MSSILPSVFKRSGGRDQVLDIEEVFNIHTLLVWRYEIAELISLLSNFIHDRDLDLLTRQVMENALKQTKVIEKEANAFQLKFPTRPSAELKTSVKMEEVTDRFIFRRIFEDIKSDLFTLSRAARTSTTNDGLRDMFVKFLSDQSHIFEQAALYGKLKGWTHAAPTYKTSKQIKREELSVGEAFHLWDHINLRYDQLSLTQFFAGFAHDIDFTAVLKKGVSVLERQIKALEGLMINFEVPLPERPPVEMHTPIDPESMEDIFMYRQIMRGIQEAIDLHLRAVVESVQNENLRNTFRDFLNDEISMFDMFFKYGKAKGWTHIPPTYTSPT